MCTNQLKHVEATLNNILKSNYAHPFAKPVTGVEGYDIIIKRKMDFGTIKENIKSNTYKSSRECIDDIFLVFANCYIFNAPDTGIVAMARHLERRFREKLELMPKVEAPYEKPASGSKSENTKTNTTNITKKEPTRQDDIYEAGQAAKKPKTEITLSDFMFVQEKWKVLKDAHKELWKLLNGLVTEFNELTAVVNKFTDSIDKHNKTGGELEVNETDSFNKLLSVNVQKPLQSEEYSFQVVSNDTPSKKRKLKDPSKNSKTLVPDEASIFKQQQNAGDFNSDFKNMEQSHAAPLIDSSGGDSGSIILIDFSTKVS
ncbi:hypothetical protein ACTXT7_013510 [Hymenolepis weldensis]